MQFKTKQTVKLFFGKYSYKIVLVNSTAYEFRYKNDDGKYGVPEGRKRLSYNEKIMQYLDNLSDYEVRVEQPLLSVYSNNKKDIDFIAKLDNGKVKYISMPEGGLSAGTIILPKVNHDFKVTLSSTNQAYESFVNWAEGSSKIKMTKSCKEDLLRSKGCWGGTYFYVTGENNLLMARMHLGNAINKVERIVKA